MKSIDVYVHTFNKKGEGIALHPETQKPIEIVHSFPQDHVQIFLKRKNKKKAKGRIEEIITPSADRVETKCPHALLCGGCIWQGLNYEKQLFYKMEIIKKLFNPYVSQKVEIAPIVPATDSFHYRNKMEFSFSENAAETKFLGLTIAKTGSYVFNLEACFLASSWMADIVQAVRQWWHQFPQIKAYHPHKNTGALRSLTVREGKNLPDQKMVILTVSGDKDFAMKKSEIAAFVEAVKKVVDPVSIYLNIVQAIPKRPTQIFEMPLYGPHHIEEKFVIDYGKFTQDFTYKISPSSFFQPSSQANVLYNYAVQLASLPKDGCVLDLYCGIGTLGMAFAPLVKKVVGIEINPHAVYDGKENLEKNNIQNMTIFQGDVAQVLDTLREDQIFFDAIIVDPPRAGLGPKTLKHLQELKSPKIMYISCNPYTQIEDVQSLISYGYRITYIQPVDQFPHTPHIENICLLELS